jgi:protein-L-isoaspartate O-methyltransferase
VYTAIHVGGAVEVVPDVWIDQLVVGGIMTVPIILQPHSLESEKETRLFLIEKTDTHKIRQKELFQVFYEPLVELNVLPRSPATHIVSE